MKKTILVIEDEEDIVSVLRFRFEKEGYNVISAYDGEKGYQLYLDEKPDLITLDLHIPKMNGNLLCKTIRRDHDDNRTPIVMLTGETDISDQIIGKVQGANEYVTKPYEIEELLSIVKKNLA